MALSIVVVNGAYNAILGRPAEGSAYEWAKEFNTQAETAQAILEINGKDNITFVKNLYEDLLNRQADASGLKYWSDRLAKGENRVDIEKEFIFSVVAQGEKNEHNSDFLALKNSNFIQNLYLNIFNRSADSQGLEFWSTIMMQGSTRAMLVQEVGLSILANPNTKDSQIAAAKNAIFEKFTTTFNGFSNLISEEEQNKAFDELKETFSSINENSKLEDFSDYINDFAATYQNEEEQRFTLNEYDKLGVDDANEPNLKATANFIGVINTNDALKGSIQNTDEATGFDGSDFNTLNISLSGNEALDLDTMMPQTKNIQKLIINNGSRAINGALGDDFTELNIKGKISSDSNISANNLQNVNINSAPDVTITFNALSALNYTGGAGNNIVNAKEITNISTSDGNDSITTQSKIKSANLGGGDDMLISAGAQSQAKIILGSGDDTLDFTSSIGSGAVNINGGAGDDTLMLHVGDLHKPNASYLGIEKISSIEKIVAYGEYGAWSNVILEYDLIKNLLKSVPKLELYTDVTYDPTGAFPVFELNAKNNKIADVSDIAFSYKDAISTLGVTVKNGSTVILEENKRAADGLIPNKVPNFVSVDAVAGGMITIKNFAFDHTTHHPTGDYIHFDKIPPKVFSDVTGETTTGSISCLDYADEFSVWWSVLTVKKDGKTVELHSLEDAQKVIAKIAPEDYSEDYSHRVVGAQIGSDAYIIDTFEDPKSTDDDMIVKLEGFLGLWVLIDTIKELGLFRAGVGYPDDVYP